MATLTITPVSSQLGPLTELVSATLEGSCDNSSVFGTGCTIYATAGSTNLSGYGVRGYFKISDLIPYTILPSLITGIRINYGYANIYCPRGGAICTDSSIGTHITRTNTYVKVALTSSSSVPSTWTTYDTTTQEYLLTNSISGSSVNSYFHFEITGGSNIHYTYYIGAILRITGLEITYTDDPIVNGSALTNQLWPAPDNTVTLKRSTYPMDGFTLSGEWIIRKYDGDLIDTLGSYNGFEVTCSYLTTPGVYLITSNIRTSGGSTILSKDVTVTISPLSEEKFLGLDTQLTTPTTITDGTGESKTYRLWYKTTYGSIASLSILVNGVTRSLSTHEEWKYTDVTITSNGTYTLTFNATNIYDSSDTHTSSYDLVVDGILQGSGTLNINGQPITNSNGRVAAYSIMNLSVSGISGWDSTATHTWSIVSSPTNDPSYYELTDASITTCTLKPKNTSQVYYLTHSVTSYGVTKSTTLSAGVSISCYKGVVATFTVAPSEGGTTTHFITSNGSIAPVDDPLPQPPKTYLWQVLDSNGVVYTDCVFYNSTTYTSENIEISFPRSDTYTIRLIASSESYEDGVYELGVLVGNAIKVDLGVVNRYSIELSNGEVLGIAARKSPVKFSGLTYMKSLNQTGSATFRLIGANKFTKEVGGAVVSATSDLLRVGTKVTIIDNLVPLWMGVISGCTEVNQNFFSNVNTLRTFDVECDESIKELSFEYVPLANTGTVNGTIPEIVSKIIDSSNIGVVTASPVNYAISIETTSRLAALDSMSNQLGWRYRCRPNITSYYKNVSVTTANKEVTLTLPSSYDGSDIRYTTDGSTPTESSTLYTSPFTVPSDTVISTLAYRYETRSSTTVTIGRYVTATPDTPLPPNVTPYYSTGDTYPIPTSSMRYTPGTPVLVDTNSEFRLMYYNSVTGSDLDLPTTFTNEITLAGPTGYDVYYTLDGSEPTGDTNEYTVPFQTPGTTTNMTGFYQENTINLSVKAYKYDYFSSDVVMVSDEYSGGITSYRLPANSGAVEGDKIVLYDSVGKSYAVAFIDSISTVGDYDIITFRSYYGSVDYLRSDPSEGITPLDFRCDFMKSDVISTFGGVLTNDIRATTYNTYLIDYKPTYYQSYIPISFKINQYAQNVTDLSNAKDKYGEVSVYGVGYSGEHIASNMRAWMVVNPDYTIDKSARIATSYDSSLDSISKIDTVVGKETTSKSFARYNLVLNGWSFPTTINANYVPTVFYSNLYKDGSAEYRHLRKIELTYDSSECPDIDVNPRFFYDQNNNKKTSYTISVDLEAVDLDGVNLSNVISSFIPMTNVIFNRVILDTQNGVPGTFWMPAVGENIRIGDSHAVVVDANPSGSDLIFDWDIDSITKANAPGVTWDDTDVATPHGHLTDVLVMDDSMTIITEGNYDNPVPNSPKYNYPTINQTILGPEGYSLMELERLACRYMQYGSNYTDRGSCKIPLPAFTRPDYEMEGYRIPMVGDRVAFLKSAVNNASGDEDYTTQNYELQSYKVDTDKMICEVKYGMPMVLLGDVLYNMLSNSGMSILPTDSEDNV